MPVQRKIIHIDMDCFYAAIEERDAPELRGKPLAVGGTPDQRGVLCTCNYPARAYGVKSAMATGRALKLCPDLTVLPVNMAKYREVSKQIQAIFQKYTSIIEPLSLDEAYLDVSECQEFQGSATRVAEQIRREIKQELKLTASAGVAPNKFLAKIASDWRKPDGLWVIRPEQIDNFVKTLPVGKLFGVGKVTEHKMHQLGLYVCQDIQKMGAADMSYHFGKFGQRLYELACGIDDRSVESKRIRKSVSVEHTFAKDLPGLAACDEVIGELYQRLCERLVKYRDKLIKNQFIKIKFADFTQTTVESLSTKPEIAIYQLLLQQGYARHPKPMRLLGLGVRFSEDENDANYEQLNFDLLCS